MADQILLTPSRVFDASGTSGAGYKAYFYLPGTMTAATVYADSDLTVPHTSPLVADSTGRFAQVFAAPGGVKVIVTDADDVAQFTLDPAFRASAAGAGASEVGFEPGAIPEANVQDAIEWVYANAASATIGSGIGVTGSATLLADLDATGTASGVYRFDNTTTGTYPTGAPAVDTGHVAIWRETASSASMTLYHDASDRVFYRRMESTTWGTWREFVVVNQGAAEGDILYRTATAWTRLAKGTAGQVLRMNSGATAPQWFTPNLWTLVATETTFSGGSATITGLSGYGEIMVVGVGLTADTSGSRALRVGDSGGVISTAIYRQHEGAADTSLTLSTASANVRSFTAILHNFNTTQPAKPVVTSQSGVTGSGASVIATAAQLDRVQILNTVGNLNGGTFYVFGR